MRSGWRAWPTISRRSTASKRRCATWAEGRDSELGQPSQQGERFLQDALLFGGEVLLDSLGEPALAAPAILGQNPPALFGQLDQGPPAVIGVGSAADQV